MKNQKESYSEPSLVKDTRRQQMRGEILKRSILAAEQEKTYMELKFQNASHYPQWNDRSYQCKCEAFNSSYIFCAVLEKK